MTGGDEEKRPSEEVARERWALRVERVALGLPVFCGVVTLSVVILCRRGRLWAGFGRYAWHAVWVNLLVAVVGSAVVGAVPARYPQRLLAGGMFGGWSLVIYITVLAMGAFFLKLFGFRF